MHDYYIISVELLSSYHSLYFSWNCYQFVVYFSYKSCYFISLTFAYDQADISICCRCFVRGNYRPGLTPPDFKKVEISEDAKSDWTDKETLHLLEAVLHYGEDWKKVSEHVGSRSEKDCIARLIRLPFGEQFMGSKERKMQFEIDDDVADESRAEIPKRLRLTPLADASNPIMAQVCICDFPWFRSC